MADREHYFIPVEGKLIEVEENVYVAYYKMGRRERYMEERDQAHGLVSYNAIEQNGIDGESGLYDTISQSMNYLEAEAYLKHHDSVLLCKQN